MISAQQRTANRQNAQHSTGPTTPEGKKRTSLNATRHGLTGQINIQTPEDRERHRKFCADLINGFQPETAHESQLAQSIADDYWRLNRIRAIENNIFALCSSEAADTIRTEDPEVHAALATAQVFLDESRQFQLLTLYEQRITRNVQKAMKQLEEIQTARKAARKEAIEEAKLLAQLSLTERLAQSPGDPITTKPVQEEVRSSLIPTTPRQGETLLVNGFVFSTTEINREIDRDNRLNQAKRYASPQSPNAKPTLTRAA
jgi:transcription termination factor NusB